MLRGNNTETPHINTNLFCCSGLWSSREIIDWLFFLWESVLFPRPVWQESSPKSFVLDWLIGLLESEHVFDGDGSLIWREELSHHTHSQPASSHLYSLLFFFSSSPILPSLSFKFIFFIEWERAKGPRLLQLSEMFVPLILFILFYGKTERDSLCMRG